MATTNRIGFQSTARVPNDEKNTRSSAANPPTLAIAAIKPVAGVGAPWYTSGVHMWNGTAAILKPKPTSSRARPASRRPFEVSTFVAR